MKLSKIEGGLRTVLDFHQAFNRHDVAAMMQRMSEDCVLETQNGATYSGKQAMCEYWQNYFLQNPNLRMSIEKVFGLGFYCVMRWTLGSAGATAANPALRGADIFEMRGDLICQQMSYAKN